METASELVFVYGTLRRGGSNAFRMDGAEFLGAGMVAGRLFEISWYPGIVLGQQNQWVAGDVFKVGPEQLRVLDEYEGLAAGEIEGSEYRRVLVHVYPADRSSASWKAWVWEWIGPVDEARVVRSGDWLEMKRQAGTSLLSRVPWCTWIAWICLIEFFLGGLAVPLFGYYKTAFALNMQRVVCVLTLLAPFAALYAVFLASKRGEMDKERRSGTLALSIIACLLSIAGFVSWLIDFLD